MRGAWIEIRLSAQSQQPVERRSPCGERGLKFPEKLNTQGQPQSLPVRGAWIEMRSGGRSGRLCSRRSPCGERGLKCPGDAVLLPIPQSLPVRGAWIEIVNVIGNSGGWLVAPRAGSVD